MVQMGADQDVFTHRQAGKRLHDLKSAGDAAAREAMWRLAGDVLAGVTDVSFARLEEAGDDGKERGLAGAVGADQRSNTSFAGRERGGVHRHQTSETAGHAVDHEKRL